MLFFAVSLIALFMGLAYAAHLSGWRVHVRYLGEDLDTIASVLEGNSSDLATTVCTSCAQFSAILSQAQAAEIVDMWNSSMTPIMGSLGKEAKAADEYKTADMYMQYANQRVKSIEREWLRQHVVPTLTATSKSVETALHNLSFVQKDPPTVKAFCMAVARLCPQGQLGDSLNVSLAMAVLQTSTNKLIEQAKSASSAKTAIEFLKQVIEGVIKDAYGSEGQAACFIAALNAVYMA